MIKGYADELKALTVRIGGNDGGSGVLIKPLNASVLYVLTACHCLEGVTEDTVELSFEDTLYKDVNIKVNKIYRNENTDTAIIVINRFDDNIRFVGFADKPANTQVNCCHTGFPSCRAGEDTIRKLAFREVNRIWHDKENLVEYAYTPTPQKHELTGLSGGGIFNEKFQLLGIHKQSAYQDKDEQLGSAFYIPCRCFLALIAANGLSPVYEFDLSTFNPFKDDIFTFDNKGAMQDLEALLGAMALMQAGLIKKNPKEMFEAFQEKRRCTKKVMPDILKREDWARFAEFLLAAKLLKPEEIDDYDVDKIVPHFQYVYSEEDFDMLDARKCLNINQMGKFYGVGCIYVIGGIKSKTCTYDVLPGKKVPDISNATSSEEFDIADGGAKCMNNLTFVNCHLFRDVMELNGPTLKDLGGKELETYQSLLNEKVYG